MATSKNIENIEQQHRCTHWNIDSMFEYGVGSKLSSPAHEKHWKTLETSTVAYRNIEILNHTAQFTTSTGTLVRITASRTETWKTYKNINVHIETSIRCLNMVRNPSSVQRYMTTMENHWKHRHTLNVTSKSWTTQPNARQRQKRWFAIEPAAPKHRKHQQTQQPTIAFSHNLPRTHVYTGVRGFPSFLRFHVFLS